ncbi:TetR/AcrR family transcriptional regulator [Nocardia gipuzkoensis]|uniref:TetR/AcrR family transcriptional regulator n=1 Tax=Nocardia gipuzkoensis TaxID=2749991 RepID=UPI001E5F7869|nr:TetR/AcrR family transcriptional regulator [Nocardia gipuzkoensis]UGT70051.1 TetR/AcrR family transcriptional regulator [Nocardia gipuzkoensis]
MTALHTPSARTRAGPSAKVVVKVASAAGATANAVIDAEGVEKLTMRRLATELGCTAMALYHHVRDKEDLLRLLLNDYADQVVWPELPEDPRERVRVAARAMHDVLAARPWIVDILAAETYPRLAALGSGYLSLATQDTYELGLDALIDGLLRNR